MVVGFVLSAIGAVPGPARASDEAADAWDLVKLVAADSAPPQGVSVSYSGAHGEARTAVRMDIPSTVTYPARVPRGATLRFGFTLQSAAFMAETPELAEPAHFTVEFVRENGEVQPLFDRGLDLRGRVEDRRWHEAEVDLEPLAGSVGQLRFRVRRESGEGPVSGTTAYYSTPRIVVPGQDGALNLVFITIDCLRADHVGAYGYPKPTTPTLDRLSARGIRFANAFANAPITLPSIPQIFTSALFPSKDQPTLVDPIARRGIANLAVVNNAWIPLWLGQGGHAKPPGTFDRLLTGDLDAKKITDRALEFVAAHAAHRFALYLHYLDAHTPYSPPERYIALFAGSRPAGTVGNTFADVEGADAGRYGEVDRERIVALYDAAIRYIDDEIGRLLEALERSGQLEHTVVVVTADHGEELWDHGRFFHGQSLYDELLHVPLLVHLPRGPAGAVVRRPVRSIDIAPSILDWLQLPIPPTFEGSRLAAAINAPDGPGDDLVATATQAQFPARFAIRSGQLKRIESLDSARVELYDVAADPREQRNIASERSEESETLGAKLDAARGPLRSVGYQAKLVAARGTKVDVSLTMQSRPNSGTFLTLDRRAKADPLQLSLSTDGAALRAHGTLRGAAGLRFDRLAAPRNLSGKDEVDIKLGIDGGSVDPESVQVGRSGEPAAAGTIDLRTAAITSETEPACEPPAAGVRVCLWRAGKDTAPALPQISDPAVKEKLRSLGYLQ